MNLNKFRPTVTLNSLFASPGCLAVSPEGDYLASYHPCRSLLITRCNDGHGVLDISFENILRVLTWNPAAKQELVCGFEDGILAVLRLSYSSKHFSAPVIFRSHACAVTQLTISSSNCLIAACGDNGAVKLWEHSPSTDMWCKSMVAIPGELALSEAVNTGLEFIGNTPQLVVSRKDYLLCWDTSSGEVKWRFSLASFRLCTHTCIFLDPSLHNPYVVIFSQTEEGTQDAILCEPSRKRVILTRCLGKIATFQPSVALVLYLKSFRPTIIHGGSDRRVHFLDPFSGNSMGTLSLAGEVVPFMHMCTSSTHDSMVNTAQETVQTVALLSNIKLKTSWFAASLSTNGDLMSSGTIKIWFQVSQDGNTNIGHTVSMINLETRKNLNSKEEKSRNTFISVFGCLFIAGSVVMALAATMFMFSSGPWALIVKSLGTMPNVQLGHLGLPSVVQMKMCEVCNSKCRQ